MKVKDVMTTSVKTIRPTGRAVAQGFGRPVGGIRDVGSSDVVYCFEDQDVQEAAKLMQQQQIRRAVVLDRGQKIVGIVSLEDVAVEVDDEELPMETLEQASEPSLPKTAYGPTPPTQPKAAHTQPVDPEAQVREVGLAQSPNDTKPQTVGKDQPKNGHHRLQKVLPEVQAVAQTVGGFKQLAEIAKRLDQNAQLQAAGEQEVLPDVQAVAQIVGGFKQLAELARTLDLSKE